jgi:importin subunit beta-1
VAQVLQQAATVTLANDVDDDTVNYVVSLREGIMDAWGGILLAYKNTPQSKPSKCNGLLLPKLIIETVTALQPYVEAIFQLVHIVSEDPNRTEGLMRSTMGVIG